MARAFENYGEQSGIIMRDGKQEPRRAHGEKFAFAQSIDKASLNGAGVPVGFLAMALLVVNNLRDLPTDREVGKRTLAVRLGDRRTRIFYVGLLAATFAVASVVSGFYLRPAGALSLIAIASARKPATAVLGGASGRDLIPVLGATGRVQLIFGVIFSIGILLSGILLDR